MALTTLGSSDLSPDDDGGSEPATDPDDNGCSAEDWRERDGSGVVLRRSEGLLVAVALLAMLEAREKLLSVEEEALISVEERDGHMDG